MANYAIQTHFGEQTISSLILKHVSFSQCEHHYTAFISPLKLIPMWQQTQLMVFHPPPNVIKIDKAVGF